MVVGLLGALPSITSGGGAIPITGGAATAGDISGATDVGFGPVNIGGVFGSEASSTGQFTLPLLIIGAIILGAIFLRRR
jgi:hypothetical protein